MAFYLSCTTICSVCTQFNPWYVAPIQLLFSWDERVGTMAPSAYRTDEIQPGRRSERPRRYRCSSSARK